MIGAWRKSIFAIAFCIGVVTVVARVLDPEEVPNLFEGDIALQEVSEEVQSRNGVRAKKRSGRLWPGRRVPYAISPLYSASETIMIEKTIRMMNIMTCVEFVPWQGRMGNGTSKQAAKKEDLLLIWPVKYPKGCWSFVGRTGGVQILSLEKERDVDDGLDDNGPEQIEEAHERLTDVANWIRQRFGVRDPLEPKPKRSRKRGCFGSEGRIMHELLHALGMFHEQSRPDRDKFIEINWENVVTGYQNNFNRQSRKNATFNFEYDFLSVMHYGATYFSKGLGPTITVKKKYLKKSSDDYEETPLGESLNIGQRIGMTKFDCLKVNDLYGCLSESDTLKLKYYHLCRIMGL